MKLMPHSQEGGVFYAKARVLRFGCCSASVGYHRARSCVAHSSRTGQQAALENQRYNGNLQRCFQGLSRQRFNSVTLKLKQGRRVIATWSDSDTGSLVLSESCTVQKGKSYVLVMSATVNGVSKPDVSVTANS